MAGITSALQDGVLSLTIDQPERKNALSQAMWAELETILDSVDANDDVRVLQVTGSGSAFCAGADISEFDRVYASPTSARDANAQIARALEALDAIIKPSVAIIRGPCMGGGCALAQACDLRLADPSARFGINPTALGLGYTFRDCQRLVNRVGIGRSRELLLTGRVINAETALDWGMINQLIDSDELNQQAHALCADLALRPALAIAAVNANLNALDHGAQHSNAQLDALFDATFESEDFRLATTAFLNRTKP